MAGGHEREFVLGQRDERAVDRQMFAPSSHDSAGVPGGDLGPTLAEFREEPGDLGQRADDFSKRAVDISLRQYT